MDICLEGLNRTQKVGFSYNENIQVFFSGKMLACVQISPISFEGAVVHSLAKWQLKKKTQKLANSCRFRRGKDIFKNANKMSTSFFAKPTAAGKFWVNFPFPTTIFAYKSIC